MCPVKFTHVNILFNILILGMPTMQIVGQIDIFC